MLFICALLRSFIVCMYLYAFGDFMRLDAK
nr:MAG TPA: hypothetical protein [Caudoviricetes sp.]